MTGRYDQIARVKEPLLGFLYLTLYISSNNVFLATNYVLILFIYLFQGPPKPLRQGGWADDSSGTSKWVFPSNIGDNGELLMKYWKSYNLANPQQSYGKTWGSSMASEPRIGHNNFHIISTRNTFHNDIQKNCSRYIYWIKRCFFLAGWESVVRRTWKSKWRHVKV